MSEQDLSRHEVFEQIRASEIARGASHDEASRIAAEKVDQVMAVKQSR